MNLNFKYINLPNYFYVLNIKTLQNSSVFFAFRIKYKYLNILFHNI